MPYLIHTAEPFFFPGGPVGCLLVHGFTGAPKEMRWMGEYLAGQGFTVLGVRLFAHATRPEDMQRARWRDWLAGLEDGYCLLRAVARTIIPMGLSMGGMLSLIFASSSYAARYPVAGVVAMSTPYALRDDPRLPFARLFSRLQPRVPKGPPDWRNPVAAADHVDYPYYPTAAIAELRDLLAEMRRLLPEVHVPVLLAHSRQDCGGDSFVPDSMQQIYTHLGSADKSMLWLENCGHVITREPERETLFAAAAAFARRVAVEAA